MCVCYARPHYLVNAFVYTGKHNETLNVRVKWPITTLNVISLITPIVNSNGNVTGDNWFSSPELVKELQRPILTSVDTIRKK